MSSIQFTLQTNRLMWSPLGYYVKGEVANRVVYLTPYHQDGFLTLH